MNEDETQVFIVTLEYACAFFMKKLKDLDEFLINIVYYSW